MRSNERLLRLADLASTQWGLFTSAQAAVVGIRAYQLKRLADEGLLIRLRHGVYRLAGAPEPLFENTRAEWLALEPARPAADRVHDATPNAVVSHRSAARLLGLGDMDADEEEFTVPRRRGTRSPGVVFRIAQVAESDWQLAGGLPVTAPLRTITDLAAAHTDGGHLATVVRDALQRGIVTVETASAALRPYAHYYGVAIGDGTGLIKEFIGQAGLSDPAEAAALQQHSPGMRAIAEAIAAAQPRLKLPPSHSMQVLTEAIAALQPKLNISPPPSIRAVPETLAVRRPAFEFPHHGNEGDKTPRRRTKKQPETQEQRDSKE